MIQSPNSCQPKIKEECGIVGVFLHRNSGDLVLKGLKALQHRGQDGAGIVLSKNSGFQQHKGLGLVVSLFPDGHVAQQSAETAIGHVRYSTTGSNSLRDVQPFLMQYYGGEMGIAHNGHIVNQSELSHVLQLNGTVFSTTSDTEVIVHLIAHSTASTFLERCIEALTKVQGAYSLLLMTQGELIACRDPFGFRPLVMGVIDDSVVFASETVALDDLGADFLREVEAGEMISVSANGLHSCFPFPKVKEQPCIFEWMYFARPDSVVFGRAVYEVRVQMGQLLGQEHPIDADIVISIPDSGTPAALGYSHTTGIPFAMGLMRDPQAIRSFIESNPQHRHHQVEGKFSVVSSIVANKKVVVVDDSLVRGTTAQKVMALLRQAGAAEVHLRIASPPIKYSCYYGVDTPTSTELLASRMDMMQMAASLKVDSVAFLSLNEIAKLQEGSTFCNACFTGDYPHLQALN